MGKTLISKFKEVSSTFSKRFAVVSDEGDLTYEELDVASDILAGRLSSYGVLNGDNVAVAMENSIEEIVSYIAILKLGASYIPLNTNDPQSRLKHIIEETQPKVLLTNLSRFRVPFVRSVKVGKSIWKRNFTNKGIPIYPYFAKNDSVYVMYTSGTTGVPKGVCVNSEAILSLVLDPALCEHCPSDRFLHTSNSAFDASTLEVWFPLLNGLACCPVKNSVLLNPDKLDRVIHGLGVTHVFFTTSLFHRMVEDSLIYIIEKLKYAFVGGEELSEVVVDRFFSDLKKGSLVNLINAYGPTESTVFTTTYNLTKNYKRGCGKIPIGRPLGGRECFILNEKLIPVKDGDVGELYIAGKGLAAGYINNEKLTRESFMIVKSIGKLVYKTGDLASRSVDGDIFFKGRVDNQIKLRGFRIELSEIENVILSALKIKRVAVVYDYFKKLISAYIVPEKKRFGVKEIVEKLRKKLPAYMVPSKFCYVEEIPLNNNGKIDYKELQLMRVEWLNVGIATEKAEDLVTTRVLNIVNEVMETDVFDLDTDLSFYGCSSLHAMSIARRISESFSFPITIGDVFSNFSVRKLAFYVECKGKETSVNKKYPESKGFNGESADARKSQLSESQRQVWMHQKLDPECPFYNETIAIKIHEKLNLSAFKEALNGVLRRHGMFHCRIHEDENGNTFQQIDMTDEIKIICKDYTSLPTSKQLSEMQHFILKFATSPFDFESEGPVRVIFCKLSDENFVLFIVAHHVVIDGVSFYQVFLPQLEKMYDDLTKSKSTLKEEKFPVNAYFEYCMDANDASNQNKIDFWKRELDNKSFTTFENDRRHLVSHVGAMEFFAIDENRTRGIHAFAEDNHVTVFSTLLSAFFVLLSKYISQKQFVISTACAGRGGCNSSDVIGNFLNNILIVSPPEGDLNFKEFSQLVDAKVRECIKHELPLSDVIKHVIPQVNYDRDVLPFDIAFVFEPTIAKTRWDLSQSEIHNGTAKFGLTFELDDRGNEIIGRAEYRTATISKAFMRYFVGNYQLILEKLLEFPLVAMNTIDFVLLDGARDKTEIIEKLPHKNMLELWDEAKKENRNSVAVVCKGQVLTYEELDILSNDCACWLVTNLDLKPQDIIAIHFDRSVDMIVAMLGILKAGCAYLPLDPEYPDNRKSYIISDAKPKAVIVSSRKRLEVEQGIVVEDMKVVLEDGAKSKKAVLSTVSPADLAYIIYTSGSTGAPKGVLIEHKNVVHLIESTREKFQLNNKDTWSCFHSYNFDFSVWEIWGALLTGGKLVVATEEERYSTENFVDLLLDNKITVLNLTPSYFRLLDSYASEKFLDFDLRLIIFGGEALRFFELKNWFLRFKNKRIRYVNMYGITEATVHSTYYEVKSTDILNAGSESIIGAPLDHLNIYVLDEKRQRLPLGVEGEMYIEGPAVARGYLNKSVLTNERFSSCTSIGGIFKTGDRAKYIDVDVLEYLGRGDNQVKIRGYRIELGEVDQTLLKHSGVKKSFTTIIGNEAPRMCSFVMCSKDISEGELKDFLEEELPSYMIPNNIVIVDNIPVNINGKVDVGSLPIPKKSANCSDCDFEITELESTVLGAWKKVLKNDSIGLQDNFFNLGGDSIVAIQLVSELKKRSLDVKMSDVFTCKNVKKMAAVIEKRSGSKNFIGRTTSSSSKEHRLTPIQLWFFSHCSDYNHYNQSVLLRIESVFQREKFEKIIKAILKANDVLNSTFYKENGSWKTEIRSYKERKIFFYEVLPEETDIDLLKAYISEKIKKYHSLLNIEKGDIFKVVVFSSSVVTYVQLIVHHLVVDAVSFRILVDELNQLYAMSEKEIETYRLPVSQFSDWSSYLYEHLPESAERMNFWEKVLKKVEGFPSDFNEQLEDKLITQSGEVCGEIIPDLLEGLHRYTKFNVHEILLAATCAGLMQLAHKSSVSIMVESHGRNVDVPFNIGKTVGWFTCFYPMYFSVSDVNNLDELLACVHSEVKSLPFDLHSYFNLKYLSPFSEDLKKYNEPDVRFNYLGNLGGENDETASAVKFEEISFSAGEKYVSKLKLDINVFIVNGRLIFSITYNQRLYQHEAIKRLIDSCIFNVKKMLDFLKKKNVKFLESKMFFTDSDLTSEILGKMNDE